MKYILEHTLLFDISKLSLNLKKAMSKELKNFDLTIEQWRLLSKLWEMDSISQTELALKTNKDLPTTKRILDKLLKKGFIQKENNLNDLRASIICLTAKGKSLENSLGPLAYNIDKKILSTISNSEKLEFEKILKLISNLFEN